MIHRPHRRDRGAVVLVALCFTAVLAISLASYLAVSRSAMQLSNRAFQTDLSKHLAETGLEVALHAFNTHDWTAWTISGTTATRTVTFPEGAAKFGSIGVVGSIKLRVDNYNAHNLDATWDPATTYRPDNIVGHNGLWYRAMTTHTNRTPSATSAYWIPEHSGLGSSLTWRSGTNYRVGDMLISNGALYRCIDAHTSTDSSRPGVGPDWENFWMDVPYWSVGTDTHLVDRSVLNDNSGDWYMFSGGWVPIDDGWTTTWRHDPTATYALGNVVHNNTSPNRGFYRYINPTPTSGQPLSNSTYWRSAFNDGAATASSWPWHSWANYHVGAVVHEGGSWYRCVREHTNQRPPNATYWSNAPLLSREWDPKWQYRQDDTVLYHGTWYLSLQNGNHGNPPPTSATANSWWASTADTSRQWSATTAYAANTYRSYGGAWYRSVTAHTGQSPNNAGYWTATWTQSAGVSTGAPVVYSEGIATLPGDSGALRTQLRAVIGRLGLFANAIAATENVSLGATTVVDSYDSVSDPAAASPGATAVIAAGATSGTAVSLNSAAVRGFVAAPGSNSSAVTYAGSAALTNELGDVSFPSPTAANVDLARISRSPFIPRIDIQPVDGGTEITSTAINNLVLGTPGAVTPSVHYYNDTSTLDLNTSTRNITIVGPVILRVDSSNGLRIRSSSGARIRITPTGSLRLHILRDFRIESNGGGVVNETGDPSRCVVLLSRTGLDTFNLSYTGRPFHGIIYLPNSSSTFTVADGVEVFGAISARNVTLNGGARLHYDTQLRHKPIPGVDQAFVITDWRELAAAERASL